MFQRYDAIVPEDVSVAAARRLAQFITIAGTLSEVTIVPGAAPVGADIVLDVQVDGVSVGEVTVPAGEDFAAADLDEAVALGAKVSVHLVSWPIGGFTGPALIEVAVDDGIVVSTDASLPLDRYVTDIYAGALARAPTGGELTDAVTDLTDGCLNIVFLDAARSLLDDTFTGAEFLALGTTNSQFVTALFLAYFNRPPDVSGLAFWIGQLGSRTRDAVRGDFATHREFVNRSALYCRNQLPQANALLIADVAPTTYIGDIVDAVLAALGLASPDVDEALVLKNTTVAPDTYTSVTVDAKGRVTAGGNGRAANPMTAPGDLITGGVAGVETKLVVGPDGKVLKVVAGLPAWADPTRGANPMTTSGDIIYGGAAGVETRLPKGADGQTILLVGGLPSWVTPTSLYAGDRPLSAPATIFLQDDFLSGGTGQSSFGVYGWAGFGSIFPQQTVAGEAGHPGILQSSTGSSSGTLVGFSLRANPAVGLFLPAETFDMVFIARLNTNDANTLVRVGLASDPSANPAASGIYFEKLAADTSWFGVTRAASSQNRTAALLAASAGWVKFRIRRVDSTHIAFSVNGGAETQVTLTIPTVAVAPFVQILNSAAATKSIDVDYFDLVLTGITR